MQAVSLQSLAPPTPSVPGGGAAYPRPEPSVLIGIFPSAVIHVRQQDAGDDGRLAAAYEKAVRLAQEQATATSRVGEMEAVKEEDEGEGLSPGGVSGPSGQSASTSMDDHGVVGDGVASKRRSIGPGGGIGRSNRPKSLLLESMQAASKEEEKDQPPLPQLTAGDATLAGAQWPLVDEIACAIREWYGVSLLNHRYHSHDLKRLQSIAAADIPRQQGVPPLRYRRATHRRVVSRTTTADPANPLGRRAPASPTRMRVTPRQVQRRSRSRGDRAEPRRWQCRRSRSQPVV